MLGAVIGNIIGSVYDSYGNTGGRLCMTLNEQIEDFCRFAWKDSFSGGIFNETFSTPDGLQITYDFSLATGMAWLAKKSSYSARFDEPPPWVNMLHPIHRIHLCDFSIDAGVPLPEAIGEETLAIYIAGGQSLGGRQNPAKTHDASNSNEEQLMSKANNGEPPTEFDVDSAGTLFMSDFCEPKIRSEFYESVFESWSVSPAHLADAMEEFEPLAWAVHLIYTEVRDEIQSDLDGISRSSGVGKKRYADLEARLRAMPEEPEEGVKAWLLALTSSEFEERVVPGIDAWFDSPPDWNWEEDHLPRGGTAQGAALEFFQNMGSDALDTVGVSIVEGEHPGSTYYAAELTGDIDAANKAAADAGIPVRFKKVRV